MSLEKDFADLEASADAYVEQSTARIAGLLEALREIVAYEPEPFDHSPEEWAKHTPETCAECKRYKEMKHPIQSACDGWYGLLHERDRINKHRECTQHFRLRGIAEAAIAKAEGR